jgi:hypothetical protein
MDESGYTGADLLNADQPVFVVASATVDDETARHLQDAAFAGVQMPELKHATLVRTANGRQRVVNFVRLAQSTGQFGTYIVHKRFALLTYLVDLWVEPSMYASGYDLYRDGGNIAESNMSFVVMSSVAPRQLDRLLSSFQKMMQGRDRPSYGQFVSTLEEIFDSGNEMVKDAIRSFVLAVQHLGFDHLSSLPERLMNPALTCAFQTVSHWRGTTEEPFRVRHDRSSNLARDVWLFEALVNPEVPAALVGRDRRTIRFPLRVERTEFVEAASSLPVQLADVLAGAAAAYAASKVAPRDVDYSTELEGAGLLDTCIGGIWPSTAVTPRELGTEGPLVRDPLEFMAPLIGDARCETR